MPDLDHLSLRLAVAPRCYRIGQGSGEVFVARGDFDGFTLIIELLDPTEAATIQQVLREFLPHWRCEEPFDG